MCLHHFLGGLFRINLSSEAFEIKYEKRVGAREIRARGTKGREREKELVHGSQKLHSSSQNTRQMGYIKSDTGNSLTILPQSVFLAQFYCFRMM